MTELSYKGRMNKTESFWVIELPQVVPDISGHDDVGKPDFPDLRKRLEEELVFFPEVMRLASEQLQHDREAASIQTRSVEVHGSGFVHRGRCGVGDDPDGVVLVADLPDDPIVQLVEVLVVAREQLRLEVDIFANPVKVDVFFAPHQC